jgi:hypothetical protein
MKGMRMMNNKSDANIDKKTSYTGLGIIMGAGLGFIVNLLLLEEISAVGIGIGVALGLVIGSILDSRDDKQN